MFVAGGGLPAQFSDDVAKLLIFLDRRHIRYDLTSDLDLDLSSVRVFGCGAEPRGKTSVRRRAGGGTEAGSFFTAGGESVGSVACA